MEQSEARPATPPTVRSPSEEELRRELADAIDRRRAADTRAKAAKVIADKAEALMCAAGEKVAYGGHRSRLSRACPLRPKSRRKGEARLGPQPEMPWVVCTPRRSKNPPPGIVSASPTAAAATVIAA